MISQAGGAEQNLLCVILNTSVALTYFFIVPLFRISESIFLSDMGFGGITSQIICALVLWVLISSPISVVSLQLRCTIAVM